jgi:hypothetical protein
MGDGKTARDAGRNANIVRLTLDFAADADHCETIRLT